MGTLYDQGEPGPCPSAAHSGLTHAARTQPYLNEVRFIGNVPTPWHSWAIVATPSTLSPTSPQHATLTTFLSELSASVHAFDAPVARNGSSKEFVEATWSYPREDVEAWLRQVEYPKGEVNEISREMVQSTLRCVRGRLSFPGCTPRPLTLTSLVFLSFRTLVAAGVLTEPAAGWNLEDFVDTEVARVQ